MSDPAAIARLHVVCEHLLRQNDPDLHQHGEDLFCFLSGSCPDLMDACSLYRSRGEHDARVTAILALRNELLRDIANQHFSSLSGQTLARAIHTAWKSYEKLCWPKDRLLDELPRQRPALDHVFWTLMKLSPHVLSTARLRAIGLLAK